MIKIGDPPFLVESAGFGSVGLAQAKARKISGGYAVSLHWRSPGAFFAADAFAVVIGTRFFQDDILIV